MYLKYVKININLERYNHKPGKCQEIINFIKGSLNVGNVSVCGLWSRAAFRFAQKRFVVGGDRAGEGRQNCVLVFVVIKVSLIYNLVSVSNVQHSCSTVTYY